MNDLTSITKKEANRLFLKDIIDETLIIALSQSSSLVGYEVIKENPGSDLWKCYGIAFMLAGLSIADIKVRKICSCLKEYIDNPNDYIIKYHNKKII